MLEPVCTDSALAASEPLIGSAPTALGWICVEQNGPWGRKALVESRLDPAIGAKLADLTAAHQLRAVLIRRPDHHSIARTEADSTTARTVLVASSHPRSAWLLRGTITDPAMLLRLPWEAIAAGDREKVLTAAPWLRPSSAPTLLVCTNARRDVCCARLGRPVVQSMAAQHPDAVWEVTHISGHRFAPTTLLLPSGYLHGRVRDATTFFAAARAGIIDGPIRGRSTWPAAGQVAEAFIRDRYHITGINDLAVVAIPHPGGSAPTASTAGDSEVTRWQVESTDGASWQVEVASRVRGERAQSCGAALTALVTHQAELVAVGATAERG